MWVHLKYILWIKWNTVMWMWLSKLLRRKPIIITVTWLYINIGNSYLYNRYSNYVSCVSRIQKWKCVTRQQWQQQCVSWSAQVQLWTGLSQLTFTAPLPLFPLTYLETCLVLDSHLARRAALRYVCVTTKTRSRQDEILSSLPLCHCRVCAMLFWYR